MTNGKCWPWAIVVFFVAAAILILLDGPNSEALEPNAPAKVTLLRVPDSGIQPQVAVDDRGLIHMVYFTGDPHHGDLNYVRSEDGGERFTKAKRVNTHPGSTIAVGNIRGAHLALGKGGRAHVAWMGSKQSEPKAPGNATPMMYTRLNDSGAGFEPERNVIQSAVGLDGGGSVAADGAGNVYVAWHAPAPGTRGEDNRSVWVAHSTDEGKTFAREQRASAEPTGACGCCGMRAFADNQGNVYALYRSAAETVNRDTYLLSSKDRGKTFATEKLQAWEVATCPMSSFTLAESTDQVVAAWETEGQVYFARIEKATSRRGPPIAAPGTAKGRKHPVVASNQKGETILAWTEGMGWNRGGSHAWQVFDKSGKPTGAKGQAKGVPTWSLVAVFARPDGSFSIMY